MELAIRVQILDEDVWISLHANALGKDRNTFVNSKLNSLALVR